MNDQTLIRTPPFSAEAERAVLGAVFIAPRVLADLVDLAIDDFFMPAHQRILQAMRAVEEPDVVTVADELKRRDHLRAIEGGESYLLTCANGVPTAENVHHYAAIVRERAVARRLIATCVETISRAYGGADIAGLTAEHRAQVASLEFAGRDGGPVSLADSVDGALDAIERRAANPSQYQVATGLRDVDELIGGFRSGNLIIVAGRPGTGKTSMAEGVAIHNGSLNVPVLIFSLEMKRQELIERALAAKSGIDGRKIVSANLDLRDWQDLHPAAEKLKGHSVWIDDRKMTTSRICSEAMRWREKVRRTKQKTGDGDDRAIVMVDYLGLVRPDRRGENRNLEVAAMSAAFKGAAGDLDCPWMVLSQLNRAMEREDRDPMLSDLRDSGAIEADADMVLFPARSRSDSDVPTEYEDAAIIIGKNRNGPVGKVGCRFRPSTMQFLDTPGSRWDGMQ